MAERQGQPTSPGAPPRILTVKEAAEELRLSESAVYRLIRAGKIGHLRIGISAGAIRLTREQIAEYERKSTVPMKGRKLKYFD